MVQVQISGGTENVSHMASVYSHGLNIEPCSQ